MTIVASHPVTYANLSWNWCKITYYLPIYVEATQQSNESIKYDYAGVGPDVYDDIQVPAEYEV